jgi:hypothetical protein
MENWQKENCVIYVCTVVLIIGTYLLGAGKWSWLGLLLLINVNNPDVNIPEEKLPEETEEEKE